MVVKKDHAVSLLEALLVTFLWSSSYVLVKIGLREISPLSFAAIRYSLAFGALFIVMLLRQGRGSIAGLGSREWVNLIIAGVAGYTIAQGLNFVGLYYLPATTTSLLLNFTPVFVLLLGISFLNESPTAIQLVGMILALIGACTYFLNSILVNDIFGVLIVLISGLGWATYMIMTRFFQKAPKIGTLELTTTTMGTGTAVLILSALFLEDLPSISQSGWIIIGWLSLVNTAFAFYLWNHVLKRVKAYELSILQNTMLVQIALLASVFLGEQLNITRIIGIALVLIGVSMVHIRRVSNSVPCQRRTDEADSTSASHQVCTATHWQGTAAPPLLG